VQSVILVLLSVDVIAMLLGSYRALLPIIADQYQSGAPGFGLLSSAPAVGSLIGVAAIMYAGDFHYKGRLMMLAILAYCGALALLGLAPTFGLALVAAAALGLTDSVQTTTRGAAIQMMTPDGLRGRVAAFQHMLQGGGPALGQMSMGAAAGALGPAVALVAGAIICAAINAGLYAARKDVRARDLGEVAVEPIVVPRRAPVEI
jgi:MFS family permease